MTSLDPILLLFAAGVLTGVWLCVMATAVRDSIALLRMLRRRQRQSL